MCPLHVKYCHARIITILARMHLRTMIVRQYIVISHGQINDIVTNSLPLEESHVGWDTSLSVFSPVRSGPGARGIFSVDSSTSEGPCCPHSPLPSHTPDKTGGHDLYSMNMTICV